MGDSLHGANVGSTRVILLDPFKNSNFFASEGSQTLNLPPYVFAPIVMDSNVYIQDYQPISTFESWALFRQRGCRYIANKDLTNWFFAKNLPALVIHEGRSEACGPPPPP